MASTMRNLARGEFPPVTEEKVEMRHEERLESGPVSPVELQVLEPESPLTSEAASVAMVTEVVADVPPVIEATQDIAIAEKKPEKKSKPKPAPKKTEKVTDQKKVNPPPPETET